MTRLPEPDGALSFRHHPGENGLDIVLDVVLNPGPIAVTGHHHADLASQVSQLFTSNGQNTLHSFPLQLDPLGGEVPVDQINLCSNSHVV